MKLEERRGGRLFEGLFFFQIFRCIRGGDNSRKYGYHTVRLELMTFAISVLHSLGMMSFSAGKGLGNLRSYEINLTKKLRL